MTELTLYGAHISPYVRKTRLLLAHKELKYNHVVVVPRQAEQPEEFKQHSPLGKIPLLKYGNHYIPDSSVICQFIDREFPDIPMVPADNLLAARVLWFEEYADSFMTASIGGHLFAERVLAKVFFKREPIQSDIDIALNEEIPAIFSYFETQLQQDFLVAQQPTLADIAVGSLFVAMNHCEVSCDAARWPKTAAYIERLFALPAFVKVMGEEQAMLKMMMG